MKKLLAIGLIAVLFASLFMGLTPSSVATEYTTVKISPTTQDVSTGQSFIINVVIDPHTAIAGAQFNLQFDPSLIQVNSVTEGNIFKQNGANTIFSPGTIDNDIGVVKHVYGNTLGAGETVSLVGTFAVIRATSKNVGVSQIDLVTIGAISVKVSDSSGNVVPVNIENGSVNIQNWVIDGDTVYIDDANVYLSATPHTISSGGWVYFNLTSKTYTGDIDVVWGFNLPNVKPTKAELHHPYWGNWTTNHEQFFYNISSFSGSSSACDFGNSYNSLHYDVTYQVPIGFNNETNETIYEGRTSTVCFDSQTNDGTNYTVYWHTDHSKLILWKDISSSFTKINYDYGDMNTWYYVKNVSVVAGKSYQMRAWVDIAPSPSKTEGKYWWALKPSSETIQQAISNNHFYALDPWIDDPGWLYQKTINITGQLGAGTHYQVNLSIGNSSGGDFHLEGHCTDFPNDIVVTDNDGMTKLPFWIENPSIDPIQMWVNVSDDLNTSQDICVYYGKSGESSASNGTNTFIFFEDFSGDLSKWNITAGSPSILGERLKFIVPGEIRTDNLFTYPIIADFKWESPPSVRNSFGFQDLDVHGDGNDVADFEAWAGNDFYTRTKKDGVATEVKREDNYGTAIQTCRISLIDSSNVKFDWKDFTETVTHTTNIPDETMYFVAGQYVDVGTSYLDYLRIRKYNDPAPSFSSAGSEEAGYPAPPENLQHTSYNFGINYTWDSNNTLAHADYFNVSINGTDHNGTTTEYYNQSTTAHGWVNTTIWSYNSTYGALSLSSISDNQQVPNNPIVITDCSDFSGDAGDTVYINFNFTDADGDTATFNTDATEGSLNSATGVYEWNTIPADWGVYNWLFNVSDGYGSVDSCNVTITLQYTGVFAIKDPFNNATNDSSLDFSVNNSQPIFFSINTTSHNITTWYWLVDGVDINNNQSNVSLSWNVDGTHILSVYGYNATYGNSNTIEWEVEVGENLLLNKVQLLLEENEMIAQTWIFLILLLINFALIFFVFKDTHDIFYGDSDVSISTVVISFLAVILSFILARRALVYPIEMPELNYFLLAVALVMVVLSARFVIQIIINTFYAMKAKSY